MKSVVVLMSFLLMIAQTTDAFIGRGDNGGRGSDRGRGPFGGRSTPSTSTPSISTPSRSSFGSRFGRDDAGESTRERRRSSPGGASSAIAIVDSGDSDASAIVDSDPHETDTVVSPPSPPPPHVPPPPPPPPPPPKVAYRIPQFIDLEPTSRPSPATMPPQNVVLPREPAPVTFPVDFSTNEASVRTSIFQGDVQATAETMIISDADSIGAGLTYEEELSPLVQPSLNRNSDPDVVAFKALALAAVTTEDASKFASAVVLSFRPDCTCGIYTPQQIDELVIDFTVDFSNTTELQQIIAANANLSLGRRRLQLAGKSPVHSFVCSSCWPKNQCKKLHWC